MSTQENLDDDHPNQNPSSSALSTQCFEVELDHLEPCCEYAPAHCVPSESIQKGLLINSTHVKGVDFVYPTRSSLHKNGLTQKHVLQLEEQMEVLISLPSRSQSKCGLITSRCMRNG